MAKAKKSKSKLVVRVVEVTIPVLVTVDESKFDEKFLSEFRSHMYPIDSIDGHAEHLAQMYARDVHGGSFIDGYGEQADMGIALEIDHSDIDTSIVDTYSADGRGQS